MGTRLHDPSDTVLFPTFAPEVLEDMKRWGKEEAVEPDTVLFVEGQAHYDFFVVLEGRLQITKIVAGQERLLAVHEPGEFAGEISMLSHAPAIATGRALGPTRVLRIPADTFRQLVAECTPLAETALQAMTARTKDVDAQLRQQEKLTALGRMAAGLAHELNNPAAAARRAAQDLRESVARAQRRALDYDRRFSDAQRKALCGLHDTVRTEDAAARGDSLARADREDALAEWMDARGLDDAWDRAAPLAAGGVTAERLAALGEGMDDDTLTGAVDWLCSTLALTAVAGELEDATGRISSLVKSIKEYSYMDRGTRQELNVHDVLESTLQMLGHKLRQGITLHREYDRSLPLIQGSGSELNQVWTNLIDNAVQAMGGKGSLWLRTSRDGDSVVVEVADDGPGIPADVLPRIWEPFFTTKSVGEGTGLGLDIARRIVERGHGGGIRVASRPGDTRFTVTLPIDGGGADA